MLIDKTDDPNLPVRLITVREADAGAMEDARAIAIEMEVAGKGRLVAYGIGLSDSDFVVTTDGPLPVAAMRKASEVTELWLKGALTIPFTDVMGGEL